MKLLDSELILNSDQSIYHLNIKPEDIATDIIFVGDQERVEEVTKYFDKVELTKQKREFKTSTGIYKGKRISVVSTGIGSDNIDIVINELDALVNIDFDTRELKKDHTSLNIVRIGTSGALQADIPVDSFLASEYAIDLCGMLSSYLTEEIGHLDIEEAFIEQTNWSSSKAHPYVVQSNSDLLTKMSSSDVHKGMTATAGGFYGPQGRILRLKIKNEQINQKITDFKYKNLRVTNLEMETSAIYGLSNLLGHKACSMNAIIANRVNGTFSKNPTQTIDNLIEYTLEKLIQ